MEIAVTIVLCIIVGVTKAIQDKIQFHFHRSVFNRLGDWWNPVFSWRRKWKDGDYRKGERFWLSSTLLVSLTDAWHFFGLIRNFSVFVTLSILVEWWLIFFYPLFFIIFHLFYTYIFERSK